MNDIERVPPNNQEAEQSVLGSCIIDRRAVEKATESLTPDDFYRNAHRSIFHAIATIGKRGPIDLVTLANALRNAKKLDEIGGVSYLATLADLVPSTSNVGYYCEIVRGQAVLRRMIEAANRITGWAYGSTDDVDVLLNKATDEMAKLARNAGQSIPTVETLLDETDAYLYAGRSTRVPCGIDTLDDYMWGGMMPGFFTLIGADPGYGKTRHLTRVAFNLMRRGIGVGFLSLEIPRQEIMAELIAMEMGVNRDALGGGDPEDFMAVTPDDTEYQDARKRVASWKLCLHSEPLDADEIEPLARRMVRDRGISALLVDYAGLVSVRGSVGPERMEHVSQCLSDCYKRLSLAGIVLCHVTKKDGAVAPWYSRKLDQDCQSFWYIVPPDSEAEERGVYDWKNIKNRYSRKKRDTLHLGWNNEYGYFEDLPRGQRGAGA